MESPKLRARIVQALLLVVSAGWVLPPADSAHGAPPVFDKPGYVYHPDVKKCSGCHPKERKGYRVAPPVDAMCYRCHGRKDAKKYLHGPLGSGDCVSCHDPHGSPYRFMTVAGPQVLCRTCHDQKSSEKHILRAKGKGCVACHDPHSSNKTFLLK